MTYQILNAAGTIVGCANPDGSLWSGSIQDAAYQKWLAAGNTPTPLPAPTLAQAQATQIAAINTAAQAALQTVIAGYPDLEVATWPQQYAEAQSYTANNTAPTPMLSAIASASGQTVEALASSVIAKASAYQSASGGVVGKRIALSAQIQAATTVAAVQAITF